MDSTKLELDLIDPEAGEGEKLSLYFDKYTIPTIGVGRNLKIGISREESRYLLANDITKVVRQLELHLPLWVDLDEVRQRALANLCFNLGLEGLLRFVNTLSSIRAGNYKEAAINLRNSLWAKQVQKARVDKLAYMIEFGKDYESPSS